jgi:hypothetical protein
MSDIRAPMVSKAFSEHRDFPACKGTLVPKAKPGKPANPEHKDKLVHKGISRDPKASMAKTGTRDLQVPKALLVHKATVMVHRDNQGRKATSVCKASITLACKETQVPRAMLAFRETQGHKAWTDFKVHKARAAIWDRKGLWA